MKPWNRSTEIPGTAAVFGKYPPAHPAQVAVPAYQCGVIDLWRCGNNVQSSNFQIHYLIEAEMKLTTFRRRHFQTYFLQWKCLNFVKISLKFVLKGPISNIAALVQIMAWRRPGDKPLSEPMMVSLPTHICVTRPQWVIQNRSGMNTIEHWGKVTAPSHYWGQYGLRLTGLKLENYYFFTFTFSRPEVRKLLLFYVFTFSRPEVRKLFRIYFFTFSRPGPRLNIKTVLSTYGDFHVKDKTAVRTSYL